MPKTDGDKTKTRILQAAERLFSQNGFDATSISDIAGSVQINKATIYYHFKDKQDIVLSLLNGILAELNAQLNRMDPSADVKTQIREEIAYLQNKKKILSVILMEALKGNASTNHALFECADAVIEYEIGRADQNKTKGGTQENRQLNLFEFFTGFIPLIMFVVLQEKWCKYYEYDVNMVANEFVEVFEKTHLKNKWG